MSILDRLKATVFGDPATRELREAERKLAESERRLRLQEAQRKLSRQQLSEAVVVDWVAPYLELLSRMRQDTFTWYGPYNRSRKQRGANFPIFHTEADLALLRAPSRILMATNNYAIGLTEAMASYVLGASGFQYAAAFRKKEDSDSHPNLIDGIQAVIDEFLEANNWYGGGEVGLEEDVFFRSVEDGEAVLVGYPQADGGYLLRFIEPEYLTEPTHLTGNPGGPEWSFGVKVDPEDTQTILGYWIQTGETSADGEEVPPERVWHYKRRCRRGVKRGTPEFAFDAQEVVTQAGNLMLNLGDAAMQQASIVGVRQHSNATRSEVEAFVDEQADFKKQINSVVSRLENVDMHRRGRWEDMPKTLEYVEGPAARNAPAHQAILQTLIRSVCTRWNAPEWIGSADASNNNYSSALVAGSHFVIRVQREQRRLGRLFESVVETALEHYCAVNGGIEAGGKVYSWEEIESLVDICAEAPEPISTDPLQVAQKRQIENQAGVLSAKTWAEMEGYDPEQEQDRLAEERESAMEMAQAIGGGVGPDGMPGPAGDGEGGEQQQAKGNRPGKVDGSVKNPKDDQADEGSDDGQD